MSRTCQKRVKSLRWRSHLSWSRAWRTREFLLWLSLTQTPPSTQRQMTAAWRCSMSKLWRGFERVRIWSLSSSWMSFFFLVTPDMDRETTAFSFYPYSSRFTFHLHPHTTLDCLFFLICWNVQRGLERTTWHLLAFAPLIEQGWDRDSQPALEVYMPLMSGSFMCGCIGFVLDQPAVDQFVAMCIGTFQLLPSLSLWSVNSKLVWICWGFKVDMN